VKEKRPFDDFSSIRKAIEGARAKLAGSGRLLVRYSGTEYLARVMVEGRDRKEIEAMAIGIADAIRKELG
jgi:phosphoglucosamine mutase